MSLVLNSVPFMWSVTCVTDNAITGGTAVSAPDHECIPWITTACIVPFLHIG